MQYLQINYSILKISHWRQLAGNSLSDVLEGPVEQGLQSIPTEQIGLTVNGNEPIEIGVENILALVGNSGR